MFTLSSPHHRRRATIVATLAALGAFGILAPCLRAQHATTPGATPAVVAHTGDHRPVVAIVADSAGTELTDFVIPRATLAESGVARVVTVAPQRGRVRLWPSTVTIEPDLTLAAFDAAHPAGADYVVVPALVDRERPAIRAWLREQAAHGATIVAICDGAWTVAAAGLLDGRRATGHWHSLGPLANKYPAATWIRDRRYVVDGPVMSTAGVTASLPASILLVERIGGRAIADSVARRIGVASWGDAHRTDDFALPGWTYVAAAANAVAWWRHDAVAVPVADGVDEIALALTLDAIPRTMRGRAVTWSHDGRPVTGRQGLTMAVDQARAGVPAEGRRLLLPRGATPPATALDSAIARLEAWYGARAATLIAMGMEYPRGATR